MKTLMCAAMCIALAGCYGQSGPTPADTKIEETQKGMVENVVDQLNKVTAYLQERQETEIALEQKQREAAAAKDEQELVELKQQIAELTQKKYDQTGELAHGLGMSLEQFRDQMAAMRSAIDEKQKEGLTKTELWSSIGAGLLAGFLGIRNRHAIGLLNPTANPKNTA